MKVKELRCEDYLEWLKDKEEYILYNLELPEEWQSENARVELGEELQIIRELKELVTKYEGRNGEAE